MNREKSEKDVRNVPITVRLNEEEHQKLKQCAAACGLSAAEFMRQLCKGNAPQPKPKTEFWELINKLYGRYLRTSTLPLLTKKPSCLCRSFGNTAADRQGVGLSVCFLVCFTVQTVGKSCITAQKTTINWNTPISSVPVTAGTQMCVLPTISVKKSWRRLYWKVCSGYSGMCRVLKKILPENKWQLSEMR